MVTCSLDGDINICDIHTNQRKGRDPVRLHKKGVYSWCWCKSYKFFASGGSDRQIIIWNPYTQKAMNYLQGHNAPVFDVLVNESLLVQWQAVFFFSSVPTSSESHHVGGGGQFAEFVTEQLRSAPADFHVSG